MTWQKPEPGPLREGDDIVFRADYLNDPHGPDGEKSPQGRYRDWRPSIHMPRWAARIFLEVTNVRVERVREITPEDAIAEGCMPSRGTGLNTPEMFREAARRVGGPYPRGVFATLWDSLNAKRGFSWESNPWVWVYEFKRVESEAGDE